MVQILLLEGVENAFDDSGVAVTVLEVQVEVLAFVEEHSLVLLSPVLAEAEV